MDTSNKSLVICLRTLTEGDKRSILNKRTRHYLDSIKAICFTALMGVTTFGFTKVEVIEQGGLRPYNQPQSEETTLVYPTPCDSALAVKWSVG